MKHIWTIFALICIILFIILYLGGNNENSKTQSNYNKTSEIKKTSNPYLSKYSGGYIVKILGQSSLTNTADVYVLNENGKATWMWIENDRSGNTNVKQKKYGTWTATENKISISIQGNTDIIKEEFELKRGIFIDTLTKRYLERTQ